MVKTLTTAIMFGLFYFSAFIHGRITYGAESELLLKYKSLAIEPEKNVSIVDMRLKIADVNNDQINDIAISGNGYLRIFSWNGKTLVPTWQSQRFSYKYKYTKGEMTVFEASPLITASYYSGKLLLTDYLLLGYTSPKSSDMYRVVWKNNEYLSEKISKSPFNWYDLCGTCGDKSSAIIATKEHEKERYIVGYKWQGSTFVQKWQGKNGARIVAHGVMLDSANKKTNVYLLQDGEFIGLLSCENGSFLFKEVTKASGATDLWKENRIGFGRSTIGNTKKGSIGELWTIQYSPYDNEYNTKLYISEFDGKKFAPFTRVKFKGIDSDMIFNMIIDDVDSDGIGEILGIEETIRKIIPRKQPDYEADKRLLTSNLFLAKWNGKEYEVKWRKKVIDKTVLAIAVDDVTGDGKKEIIITDENGYLYVYELPTN